MTKYLLKFTGGIEKKVSKDYADRVDKMFAEDPEQLLKFKDGSAIKLARLISLDPIREHREASDLTAAANVKKIVDYLDKPTEVNYPNARKSMIEAYMKGRNHQRKRMGKSLLFKREMLKDLGLNNGLVKTIA